MLSKIKQYKKNYQYKKCRDYIYSLKDYDKNPESLLHLAECYYKDNELYYKVSFKKALELLKKRVFFYATDEVKKERLNLIGAVFKRYWIKEKKIECLLKSIKFYEKAWKKYKNIDRGYGGVNAANLYDELGCLLDNNYYKSKADNLRNEIIDLITLKELLRNTKWLTDYQLTLKDFEYYRKILPTKWDYHTLITAYFGLGEFNKVEKHIKTIKHDDEWERYTTYETCYKLNELKQLNAKSVLANFFDNVYDIKKVGLALSGGGFRASLFHLGSLVALAKADKLKDISVISTVSGGSIIGVLYYLKVKELLESKKDENITKKDYLKLVDELIQEFLSVITTKNIRNEVLGFDLILPDITRTKKIAKLYDKYFYSKYNVKYLKDLVIRPLGEKKFNPFFQNFKRHNKVPLIVINATNLNNGHNFQFHATKMGEAVSSEYDRNFMVDFLREGCETFDKFLISEAVAASSAVPGIFPALNVKLGEVELNLVDGGVYENIGLNAMFSENVDEIIISDGGYEMGDIKTLDFFYKFKIIGFGKYLKRTVDVLMDVNKDLTYEKIQVDSIKNILAENRRTFEINCQMNSFPNEESFEELFSNVRTDLDKFNLMEAQAIIFLGYKQMMKKLNNPVCIHKFDFESIESLWDSYELRNIMKQASKFKFWR